MTINSQIIHAMLAALDACDKQTGRHCRSVAKLAFDFGSFNGLAVADVKLLYGTGLVHDIGKIGVPERILTKPGRLTREEYAFIKKHPVIGADILHKVDVLHDMVDIVRHHHERYDGTGYPDGLIGDSIPFFSRIIALCDSYDAMVGRRRYKSALAPAAALREIQACQGTQFDPVLTDKFVSFILSKLQL